MAPDDHTVNDLESRFARYAIAEELWEPDKPVLLAVSGGIDSVVLAHLMKTIDLDCAMAHCNFHLRNHESDSDEAFTGELAKSLGMPLFVEHFNTFEYAFKEGISVEMAARDLRYTWFRNLLKLHQFQCVVTGHHADDQIETLFLNLSRGTGISGLRGMLPKSGQIVRPMLRFYRSEIMAYAKAHRLSWCEDSSNASAEIRRNKIRHEVVPLFESLNPNYRQSIINTMGFLRDAEIIYRSTVEEKISQITSPYRDGIRISIPLLKQLTPQGAWLFEVFSPYGFNQATIQAIGEALDAMSGKQFFSATHRMIKDRESLLITPRSSSEGDEVWEYFINESETGMDEPFMLECHRIPAAGYTLEPDPKVAALDADRLQFPLTLRRWSQGDAFVPLGMHNKKKLSDFFTNLKLPIPEKEQVWVVTSGADIVWVVGYRIDQRYRVTEHTRNLFVLRMGSCPASDLKQ